VEKAKTVFHDKLKLWSLVDEWEKKKKSWLNVEFQKLNVEEMNNQVIHYSKTAIQLTRTLERDAVAANQSWY